MFSYYNALIISMLDKWYRNPQKISLLNGKAANVCGTLLDSLTCWKGLEPSGNILLNVNAGHYY